jgi:hypothetical protein
MRADIVALALALLSAQVATAEPSDTAWQPHQIALGAAVAALHVADWAQTRNIARSNEPGYSGPQYIERGPVASFIGSTPIRGQVDAYMIACGAFMFGLAHVLPEYRTAILAVFGVAKVAVVIHNKGVGLSIGGAF